MNHKSLAPLPLLALALLSSADLHAHGTVVYPVSRVYRVFQSDPANPDFALAQAAVAIDGTAPYYDWNSLSRRIPEAVAAGLPPAFDFSFWMPDGELASAGRTDPSSTAYSGTYIGLDQVSADWPTTPVTAGGTIQVEVLAVVPHLTPGWDVWMTTPDWSADTALNWAQMEYQTRPTPTLSGSHFLFDLDIPADRTGHHVLWITWHRNDGTGEVYVSACDVDVQAPTLGTTYCNGDSGTCPCGNDNDGSLGAAGCANSSSAAGAALRATGSASLSAADLSLTAAGMVPSQPGLFFQGNNAVNSGNGNPFGDGLRCAGGGVIRLQVRFAASDGTANTSIDIGTKGGCVPGDLKRYQLWSRDPGTSPCSSLFNLSNGVELTWSA
jgi:predicted carbohydrate-binding protein with CBM5 and CBM33 domain